MRASLVGWFWARHLFLCAPYSGLRALATIIVCKRIVAHSATVGSTNVLYNAGNLLGLLHSCAVKPKRGYGAKIWPAATGHTASPVHMELYSNTLGKSLLQGTTVEFRPKVYRNSDRSPRRGRPSTCAAERSDQPGPSTEIDWPRPPSRTGDMHEGGPRSWLAGEKDQRWELGKPPPHKGLPQMPRLFGLTLRMQRWSKTPGGSAKNEGRRYFELSARC